RIGLFVAKRLRDPRQQLVLRVSVRRFANHPFLARQLLVEQQRVFPFERGRDGVETIGRVQGEARQGEWELSRHGLAAVHRGPLVRALKSHGGRGRYAGSSGTTAVASISTLARSSINAFTSTAVIAGKCRPITSR